jgi:hypothetical protein
VAEPGQSDQIPAFSDEHLNIEAEALNRPQLPETPDRHPRTVHVHPLPPLGTNERPTDRRPRDLPVHPLPPLGTSEHPVDRRPRELAVHPLPSLGTNERATNRELQAFEYPFSGAWIPDEDPLKIGIHNFADLQNLRYTNSGLEGVQGYTRLTVDPLSRRLYRSGIQFSKVIRDFIQSFVMVQSWANLVADSAVYIHTADIPEPRNFVPDPIWLDSPGSGLGRFATGQDGTVVYCNGVDSTIWGSYEHRVAALINYDDPNPNGFRFDYTDRVTDVLSDPPAILIRTAVQDIWLLVGSTRPIQGIKFYVLNPNTGISTSTVEYWHGDAVWRSVSFLVDGTSVDGITMAQTGSMTFYPTHLAAHTRYDSDRQLYYYRVHIGATGTPLDPITLTYVTVDTPMQPIVDIWDGVDRKPVVFTATTSTVVNLKGPWIGATTVYNKDDSVTFNSVTYVSSRFDNMNNQPDISPAFWALYQGITTKDYTLEVQNPSSADAPVAADISGPALEMLVGFETKQVGLRFKLITDRVNNFPSVLLVSFWNGADWIPVQIQADTTRNEFGTQSLHQSGVLSWSIPLNVQGEFKYTTNGVTGYFYKLNTSADFGSNVLLDTISGIPAQRWEREHPIPGYGFPFTFAGRYMLARLHSTGELNRIDYTAPLEADVWNGKESSDQGKAIFIGQREALTAAIEMTNRYAGNLTALAVVLKASETWILQGNSPDNFQEFIVNDEVGCPVPLSLTLADVPSVADQQALRNIALWCSNKGPMMFDGTVLLAMRFPQQDGSISSIDRYFRPIAQQQDAVNTDAFERGCGWYNTQWSEYNLLLPCGAGAVECNTWLVADMRRKKWYRKVPVAYPQMVLTVHDTRGAVYNYGGVDSGHLLVLENGTTWDGFDMTHRVLTADAPQGPSAWNITRTRYIKIMALVETGMPVAVVVKHAGDSSGQFVEEQLSMPLIGTARWVRKTSSVNLVALTHQWEFTCTTSDKERAPRLLGFGTLYEMVREDLT